MDSALPRRFPDFVGYQRRASGRVGVGSAAHCCPKSRAGRSGVAAMQALVGALVDSARGRVAWVALSKGEEVPDEAAVRVLRQLKHEAEWRLRCPTPDRAARRASRNRGGSFQPRRQLRTSASREPPSRPRFLDGRARPEYAMSSARPSAHLVAPLVAVESDRDVRQAASWRSHARTISAGGK